MIHELLKTKIAKERANLKGLEIVRAVKPQKYNRLNYDIEIVETKAIEGGIEVLARAWKDGKPLGFGKDGSVETERFRIFNPPILVDDPNGTIIREGTDRWGNITQRKLREDPVEAIRQTLAHTISVSSRTDTNVVSGSIGNTTSTFYPAAGAVAPVDGDVYRQNEATWAAARDAATGDAARPTSATALAMAAKETASLWHVFRGYFGFDHTSIGTDTISSATFSLASTAYTKLNPDSTSINIVSATPASTDNLVIGDFPNVGATVYATKTIAGWTDTDNTYNDFIIDTAGITYITNWTSHLGFLGVRIGIDTTNTTPTGDNSIQCYTADTAGTTSDPKLVVVHSAVAVNSAFLMFM